DAHAAGGPAADLAGQVATPASEPGQQVLELGELDLGLALAALGVLGEDVEDQRGPVDDLDLDDLLEPAELARGELAVTDHGVGTGGRHDVGQLLSLTRADVRGGVGPVTALDQTVEDDGARGLGEELELAQRVL